MTRRSRPSRLTPKVKAAARSLTFRTNLDDNVPLDAEHPLRVRFRGETGEPRPYILVRGRLEARILRPVFYELVAMAEPAPGGEAGEIGVWSGGQFFSLGRAETLVFTAFTHC